jgi:tetratricopeptide (TPR) repeat protein
MFARFWTNGETKGADAIEVAAASLLVGKQEIKDLLPKVEKARSAATTDAATADLDLLLASGYVGAGDGVKAKVASERLLRTYPDSMTAVKLTGAAYGLNKDWAAWTALLDARQAKHPMGTDVVKERSAEARMRGDYPAARKALQSLIDSGKADANDYNEYAWLQLFDGTVNADGVQAAQQSSMLSKNQNYGAIHTLACLYAAEGKTTEARQLLLQAMTAGQLAEPNSSIWYGFGSIYERYGVKDAAIAAYRRVEKPEGRMDPVDTYVLAESRLKALQAE